MTISWSPSYIGFVAAHAEGPVLPVPEGHRVPYGWKAIAVDSAQSGRQTRLVWNDLPPASGRSDIRLRLTVASDVREEKLVEATLGVSGELLGLFDIRYGYVTQVFEISIDSGHWPAVIEQGIALRMKQGAVPLWIFYDGGETSPGGSPVPEYLSPQLLLAEEDGDKLGAFYRRLNSLDSIQPFGWLEGCVVDGLYALNRAYPGHGWLETFRAHMRLYFPDGEKLAMEDHFGHPSDGQFYLDESTLPIAIIAKVWPDHPVLDAAVRYWLTASHAVTAEGCYTMAYPMTVIASQRGDRELAGRAVEVLRERVRILAEPQGLWQCYRPGSNADRYYNWARAYAWYMLGLTRSLLQLRSMSDPVDGLDELETEIQRIADHVMALQHTDGLWFCFVHEPETGIDTSGSAGIAAALALGANSGLLPERAKAEAERAFVGLTGHLTPDGWLGGVAQNNRGGEALQKSGYRVLSQMAMGLMGQLAAEVAIGRSAKVVR